MSRTRAFLMLSMSPALCLLPPASAQSEEPAWIGSHELAPDLVYYGTGILLFVIAVWWFARRRAPPSPPDERHVTEERD